MGLTLEAFSAFFRELHGYGPFQWQIELLTHVVSSGAWPERIAAPTGSGKTSVIDVHLFANAIAEQDGLNLPRRLVMTVNRRSLIDDHAEHAARLALELEAVLADAYAGATRPTTREVATLLARRAGEDVGGEEPVPVRVSTVRGGMPLDRSWTAFPLAPAVLCMTPDMWGSRALFRGYGTSRYARPMEAAFLTRDCVLVVDEAHLNRQLLLTARRIGELDGAALESIGVPPLQVVETTATPVGRDDGRVTVGVDPDRLGDGAPGAELGRRLATVKPLELKTIDVPRDNTMELADVFVAECLALGEDPRFKRAPIGCVVNTVALARAVAAKLRESPGVGESEVLEVIGGLRPFDREQLSGLTGLGAEAAAPAVRYLVGTQALEVGIDVDVSALVTELAPAAAVVQRAGRVNRRGRSADALVVVLIPARDPKGASAGPYDEPDLVAAAEWLGERARTAEGLAPLALYADPPPAAQSRRVLFQRLEWYDALRFAHTSQDTVFADRVLPGTGEDLTLWLRDDLSARAEAFVVVRDHMPEDDEHARRVAQVVRPLDDELFSTSLQRVRKLAADLLKARSDKNLPPAFIYYRRSVAESATSEGELMAGDVLVVPPGTDVLSGGGPAAGHDRSPAGIPADVHDELAGRGPQRSALANVEAGERYRLRRLLPGLTAPGGTALEGSHVDDGQVALAEQVLAARKAAAGLWAAQETASDEGDVLGPTIELLRAVAVLPGVLDSVPSLSRWDRGLAPDGEQPSGEEWPEVTVVPGLAEDDPIFVMITSLPVTEGDQASERAPTNVFLDDHAAAVADRAAAYARGTGLAARVADAVETAARLHDEGKRFPAFQAYLASRWPQPRPLAKSKYKIPLSARVRLGLTGWRHEQLSAVLAWAETPASPETSAELVTWLVGTSHGRGRPSFDADADRLLHAGPSGPAAPGDEGEGKASPDHVEPGTGPAVVSAARRLFDDGIWEEWLTRLMRAFGPWGLAYLEGLVRAADQTVSGEGR